MISLRPFSHRKALLIWITILLLAWAVWLRNLNLGSLSFDETATYFVAYRPVAEIIPYLLRAANEHPPVYFLLMRAWLTLAGTTEFSLRLFSLLVGMFVLALSGWVARLATRQRGGTALWGADWVTAVLLVAMPGIAFYVRDARMYSLTAVWALLAAGLLLRDWVASQKQPRWNHILALMFINGLALFTHYYLLLIILTQPLILLATKRWRPFGVWTAVHGLPALLGLIWLAFATGLQNSLASAFAGATISLPTPYQITSLVATMLSSSMSTAQFYVLPIILPLLLAGLMVAWWRQWRIGVWLSFTLLIPFMLAYLLPRTPQPRYFVFLLPFAALTLAHVLLLPLQFVKSSPVRWVLGVGLTLLLAGLLARTGLLEVLASEKSSYGRTVNVVSRYAQPSDETLFYGPWQVIPFYYYDPGGLPPRTLLPPYSPPLLDPAQAEPVLTELFATAQRVWMIPMAEELVDPELFVQQWLRDNAHKVWQEEDASLYLPPLGIDAPQQTVDYTFGQALRLQNIASEAQPIGAGEALRLAFSWQFLQPVEEGMLLTLSLMDDAGNPWVTVDSVLQNSTNNNTKISYEGLSIPQSAPPGTYTIQMRLLDQATGVPLLVDGQESLSVQTVTVGEPEREAIFMDTSALERTQFCPPDGEGNCVQLLAVQPGGEQFQAGFPLPLQLQWQAPAGTLPDLQARLTVVPDPLFSLPGMTYTPIMSKTVPIAFDYPSSQWLPERLVTRPVVLPLPVDAPAGRMGVRLEVLEENGRIWTPPDAASFPLFSIEIEERPVLTEMPTGMTPIEADFGDEIGVRGYRVDGDVCAGGQVQLTYVWQALKRPSTVYAVFNHLVTADETMVAQVDGWPQGGRLLTSQWQPGEYIEDSYLIDIPADAPAGSYTLYVGLYAVDSGDRLPAAFQDGQYLPTDRVPIPLPEMCQ